MICGAGINCTGVLPDGTTVRFAAVGHISGDWGGGGHLWQEAMWWAARAEDGRGPDTALRTALPGTCGAGLDGRPDRGGAPRRPPRGAVHGAHAGAVRGRRRRRPRSPPTSYAGRRRRWWRWPRPRSAGSACPDAPIDVVLGGGVLTAGTPRLMDEIDRRLAERGAARRRRAWSRRRRSSGPRSWASTASARRRRPATGCARRSASPRVTWPASDRRDCLLPPGHDERE